MFTALSFTCSILYGKVEMWYQKTETLRFVLVFFSSDGKSLKADFND